MEEDNARLLAGFELRTVLTSVQGSATFTYDLILFSRSLGSEVPGFRQLPEEQGREGGGRDGLAQDQEPGAGQEKTGFSSGQARFLLLVPLGCRGSSVGKAS